MIYKILKDDELINTIVADEAFAVEYCEQNGYTYELVPERDPVVEPETPEEEVSVWDELDAAYQEGVDSV